MPTYSDFYFRTYSTKSLSFEHLFCLFTYFLIFAVPFYFAFGGSNFWFDEIYGELDIKYTYTGYYAIEVSYIQSTNLVVGQFANIPGSTLNSLVGVTVSLEESASSAQYSIELSDFGSRSIQSINLMLFYDIEINAFEKIYSAAYAISLTGNVKTAVVSGKVRLSVISPLNALTETESKTVNKLAYLTANFRTPSTFSDLMETYLNNQYRLESGSQISISEGTDATRTLELNLLKDTAVVIPYYPSILQTLKLKFSRYIGFLILTYLIFRNIMVMLIEEEGLECSQEDEIPPSKKA